METNSKEFQMQKTFKMGTFRRRISIISSGALAILLLLAVCVGGAFGGGHPFFKKAAAKVEMPIRAAAVGVQGNGDADTAWYTAAVGTSSHPDADTWCIGTPNELRGLADLQNEYDTQFMFNLATIKLTADLDMSGYHNTTMTTINNYKYTGWTPIAVPANFIGTFDGQNHTIANLKCHSVGDVHSGGLFASAMNLTGKSILNLIMTNVDIDVRGTFVGAITARGSSLENCRVMSGTVKGNGQQPYDDWLDSTGGLCAYLNVYDVNKVTDCYNAADVYGNHAGGIIGMTTGISRTLEIKRCANRGNVVGAYLSSNTRTSSAGGIVGILNYNGDSLGSVAGNFTDLSNYGNIGSGTNALKVVECSGGIFGQGVYVDGMQNCANYGTIDGQNAGGLSGHLSAAWGPSLFVLIKHCLNVGKIKDSVAMLPNYYYRRYGGLFGWVSITYGAIINCYVNTQFEYSIAEEDKKQALVQVGAISGSMDYVGYWADVACENIYVSTLTTGLYTDGYATNIPYKQDPVYGAFYGGCESYSQDMVLPFKPKNLVFVNHETGLINNNVSISFPDGGTENEILHCLNAWAIGYNLPFAPDYLYWMKTETGDPAFAQTPDTIAIMDSVFTIEKNNWFRMQRDFASTNAGGMKGEAQTYIHDMIMGMGFDFYGITCSVHIGDLVPSQPGTNATNDRYGTNGYCKFWVEVEKDGMVTQVTKELTLRILAQEYAVAVDDIAAVKAYLESSAFVVSAKQVNVFDQSSESSTQAENAVFAAWNALSPSIRRICTITPEIISITPANDSTQGNPLGTNGSFSFTVGIGKQGYSATTATLVGTIVATPYDTSNQDITSARTAIEAAFPFTTTQMQAFDEAAAESVVNTRVYNAVREFRVTYTITRVTYTAAVAAPSSSNVGSAGVYTFTVAINKGSGTQQITANRTLNITQTAFDDNNSDINAAKAAIEGTTFVNQQVNIMSANTARGYVGSVIYALDLHGCTFSIADVSFLAANEETAPNEGGHDGNYIFNVTIAKGTGASQQVQKTLVIQKTLFDTFAADIEYARSVLAVEGFFANVNQSQYNTREALIGYVEGIIATATANPACNYLNGVVVEVVVNDTNPSFMAAVAETATTSGANGLFNFYGTFTKGNRVYVSAPRTVSIIRTPYDPAQENAAIAAAVGAVNAVEWLDVIMAPGSSAMDCRGAVETRLQDILNGITLPLPDGVALAKRVDVGVGGAVGFVPSDGISNGTYQFRATISCGKGDEQSVIKMIYIEAFEFDGSAALQVLAGLNAINEYKLQAHGVEQITAPNEMAALGYIQNTMESILGGVGLFGAVGIQIVKIGYRQVVAQSVDFDGNDGYYDYRVVLSKQGAISQTSVDFRLDIWKTPYDHTADDMDVESAIAALTAIKANLDALFDDTTLRAGISARESRDLVLAKLTDAVAEIVENYGVTFGVDYDPAMFVSSKTDSMGLFPFDITISKGRSMSTYGKDENGEFVDGFNGFAVALAAINEGYALEIILWIVGILLAAAVVFFVIYAIRRNKLQKRAVVFTAEEQELHDRKAAALQRLKEAQAALEEAIVVRNKETIYHTQKAIQATSAEIAKYKAEERAFKDKKKKERKLAAQAERRHRQEARIAARTDGKVPEAPQPTPPAKDTETKK